MRKTTIIAVTFAFLAFAVFRSADAGQRTVTDSLGRVVRIPENPSRVVSLAPSLTEVVFATGQGARLVGATLYSNYPPEARDLPRVGSYVHLDIEKIMALKPDLCLAIKDGNPIAVVRRLEAHGAEAWMSDIAEWLWYTNNQLYRVLRREGRILSKAALQAALRSHFRPFRV